MNALDKLLFVHFKCDRKHRWSVDLSKDDTWYMFPNKLTPRLYNNLADMLNNMVGDLQRCSNKDTVYIHKGIHKKNIVMNQQGKFKFMHHSGIYEVEPSEENKVHNVLAARKFLRQLMPMRYGGGDPVGASDVLLDFPKDFSKPPSVVEANIIEGAKTVADISEATLTALGELPQKFVKLFSREGKSRASQYEAKKSDDPQNSQQTDGKPEAAAAETQRLQ